MGSLKSSRLSRLRDALRGRDWLGIAIELLVVTLGVLLAFQIDQWGQDRQRRVEERQFMEELFADTQSGITELKGLLEAHDKVLREVPVALEARGNPAKISALPRRRDFGCGLTRPLLAPYNDTAYEELVQSGRISLLSDPKLRTLIRDLVASQKWGASQGTFTLELLNMSLPPVTPYYDVTINRDSDPKCRIDWPRLLADDEAVYAATRLVRRHRVVWEVRKRTFDLTLQVQRMLACKLDKPECPK